MKNLNNWFWLISQSSGILAGKSYLNILYNIGDIIAPCGTSCCSEKVLLIPILNVR